MRPLLGPFRDASRGGSTMLALRMGLSSAGGTTGKMLGWQV